MKRIVLVAVVWSWFLALAFQAARHGWYGQAACCVGLYALWVYGAWWLYAGRAKKGRG